MRVAASRVEPPDLDAAEAKSRRFLTAAEMENFPKPDYLIDGVMAVGSLAVLYGAPGCFKSFLALGWAFHVATGFRWLNRSVTGGPVLYVAGEGSAGMGARLRALRQHYHYSASLDIYFLTTPANLIQPGEARELLIDMATEIDARPALIIIDTLSRDLAGADENSQGDMSTYIANVDLIRRATGATILIIHHTNASAERERGSTVLRGAADTMIQIKNDDGLIVVSCEKQKDDHPFDKLHLQLETVGESAVLTAKSVSQLPSDRLTDKEAAALESLTAAAPPAGLSASTWLKVSTLNDRTFYRALKLLQERGFVRADREGRGALYTATPAGKALVNDNCQLTANSLPDSVRHSLTASGGVLEPPHPVSNGGPTDEEYELWESARGKE